ncbi:MAG: DUF4416 family protein [Nitrospirae bacterium]|nr:DUF4416 family protein [Nitrospirota bacterium]MBI5097531.1 DUF4416 family protein [Nitrospirota bacterium]MBI5407439.1 DUF4416 family protein [Nitrospirota bacterium]
MGLIKPVEEAKLFTALLSREERLIHAARERLSLSFGPVDFVSEISPWAHTRYYKKEMGTGLKRQFLFFERHILPDTLSNIKNMTNDLEADFRTSADAAIPGRPINIDPGYLTLAKVVLASTKNYCHRIYIGNGIYAEVTLYYRGKSYQSLPHTYPDYGSREYIDMFNRVREEVL